jgi:hypothetical protein
VAGNARETVGDPKVASPMKTLERVPVSIFLMESMRTFCYTPEAAIADLISGPDLGTRDPYL